MRLQHGIPLHIQMNTLSSILVYFDLQIFMFKATIDFFIYSICKLYICEFCLKYLKSQETLSSHLVCFLRSNYTNITNILTTEYG